MITISIDTTDQLSEEDVQQNKPRNELRQSPKLDSAQQQYEDGNGKQSTAVPEQVDHAEHMESLPINIGHDHMVSFGNAAELNIAGKHGTQDHDERLGDDDHCSSNSSTVNLRPRIRNSHARVQRMSDHVSRHVASRRSALPWTKS